MTTRLTVIGSINLDLVATGPRLPGAGETVTGATLARHPGGKGANQALAAARLGARVALIGRVGADAMADEALALLRAGGVDLGEVLVDADQPTGVALIAVDPAGENQIVVAPGANLALRSQHVDDVTLAMAHTVLPGSPITQRKHLQPWKKRPPAAWAVATNASWWPR
jgi:ribokinase